MGSGEGRGLAEIDARLRFSRAVEAAIWGMPIVAAAAIRNGSRRDLGAADNDIVFFSAPADWRFQTTTPNASTYYIYGASNLRAGPVVLEVPAAVGAGIYGQICDMWDVPLTIVGPGGADAGNGGTYLLIDAGDDRSVPDGYVPVRVPTANVFWLMRTIPQSMSDADVQAAIGLLKQIRMYPVAGASRPPEQTFIDAAGRLWDGIPRMDATFYAELSAILAEESVLSRDLAMMNQLKTVGIEPGKPFDPDDATRAILDQAAGEAKRWLQARLLEITTAYWESSSWFLPDMSGLQTQFSYQTATGLDYDNRAVLGFYGWAPPMKADTSAPTIYVQTFSDADQQPLTGDRGYRLRVPGPVPAAQYWSLTLYDSDTAAFIREAAVISIDSFNEQLHTNADGSVDLYCASTTPKDHPHNWLTTAPGREFFAMFRLYGPQQPFFDRHWQLPDFEITS
jgi:hypothetical protein